MLVINGVELELNIFEANQAEMFEDANKRVLEEIRKVINASTGSESIKLFCDVVYDFFDDVFGEGTGDQVFEGRLDMLECLEAYTEVIEYSKEGNKKANELLGRIQKHSSPTKIAEVKQSRAERRAQSRK